MTANTPKKPAVMNYSPSSFLTVRVGTKNPQDFLLHKGIVCARSEFFRRAMSGDWAEKEQRLVKLPKEDRKIFALYVNLVYTNDIITGSTFDQDYPNHQDCILSLVKLYIFADMVQDREAKNKTIATLRWCVKIQSPGYTGNKDVKGYLPNGAAVQLMYDNTPQGSCGRRLMVHFWCDDFTDILAESEIVCKDFYVDLLDACHAQCTVFKRNLALKSKDEEYYET